MIIIIHTHTHIYVLTFLCSLLFFDPLAVCDYQEDKDKRGLFASEAGTSAISSPSPSDPPQTVYGNTMFPTSPRDSSSTASMAQLLTSLSDSSTSSVKKSGEGLIYTTVHFHTSATSSDDAAPKIRLKKEEESCESLTVNHGNSYG